MLRRDFDLLSVDDAFTSFGSKQEAMTSDRDDAVLTITIDRSDNHSLQSIRVYFNGDDSKVEANSDAPSGEAVSEQRKV
jgi:hypothetical protein